MFAGFADFAFYEIKLKGAHLVAGFGRIVDLKPADLLTDLAGAEALVAAEPEVIAHMNADHAETCRLYATKLRGAPDGDWRCVGCDPEGLDLQIGSARPAAAVPAAGDAAGRAARGAQADGGPGAGVASMRAVSRDAAWLAIALMLGAGGPARAQETIAAGHRRMADRRARRCRLLSLCEQGLRRRLGGQLQTAAAPAGADAGEFENHHRGLAKHYSGTGNMRAVRVSEPKERTIEDVRVLQISREVDWTSGRTTFSIESRLIGSDKSFSLVSDSPKREWTADNFEGFLRSLVAIAGIKGR